MTNERYPGGMARKPTRKRRPRSFTCPVCGSAVAAGALVCRECGSDENTGWSEDTLYDGLDLPDPGYGAESAPRAARSGPSVQQIGVVLLVLFVLLIVWRLF
jgi:hypothetical protein